MRRCLGLCGNQGDLIKIDLHTHSDRSDGTDDPATLVAHAAQAGLDVVALTDHDTTVGWADAQVAADHHGIRLIRGIELSTKGDGIGHHLLAYGFDAKHPAVVAMLERGIEAREGRIPAILDRLRTHQIDLTLDAVTKQASGKGSVGRPHIAAAMVEGGYVPSQEAAFAQYLRPGGSAYVSRYAPDIEEAIEVVLAAGGVTVLAHPRGRRGQVTDERFAELKKLGLAGIEVDHQEHDEPTRNALRALARELDLVVTGSSDYHGTRKVDHDLGCNTTDPEEFQRLLSLVQH